MVSHLDLHQQAQSQRAPSVSSSAPSSRRHRQHRSHHGGSSQSPQNEFPVFAHTGDVEICLTTLNGRKEQRYLLHRLILTQCSAFFENDINNSSRLITQGPAPVRAHQSPPVSHGTLSRIGENESSSSDLTSSRLSNGQTSRKRWRYALDWGNAGEDDIPMLVQREATDQAPPPVTRNKPPPSSSSFFRSMSNFSALNLNNTAPAAPDPDDELLKDYDNLFRIFYNYPPLLETVNIATAYSECKALLHLADVYDALEVVGPRMDHHLLRFGNRLFKQIAKYPPSYLKLAYLAKSKVIFAEALIHVVGQWPLARQQLQNQIDPVVTDLIEDKVDALEEAKAKVEGKLFRLTLTTSRGERVTPSNSFLDWLAISLYRQWLAENTTKAPTSILKGSCDPSRPGSNGTAQTRDVSGRTRATNPPSQRQPISSGTSATTTPQTQPASGRIYRLMGSTSNSA